MRLIYGLLLYWLLFAPALTYYDGGGFFCLHVGVDTRGCFVFIFRSEEFGCGTAFEADHVVLQ
jgi:hypothetical protein